MYDITALGELLIDFTPCGTSEAGRQLFEQNPGGAPANVLVSVSRLGQKAAFIGKVGDDMHGALLKKTLEENNVDTSGLIVDPNVFTTLAFVTLTDGERNFSFARKPGADTQLRKEEVNLEILKNTRIFHFGSLSLTDEPARSATIYAVENAKQCGALISYDPNYRAPLWKDRETAVKEMRSVIKYVRRSFCVISFFSSFGRCASYAAAGLFGVTLPLHSLRERLTPQLHPLTHFFQKHIFYTSP